MLLLVIFAFVAGMVTVLSPCILPLLPIILAAGYSEKRRPWGVVFGFVASFTFFTLFLSTAVKIIGISADWLRVFSVVVLVVFGSGMLFPRLQSWWEIGVSSLIGVSSFPQKGRGWWGGVLVGLSLGLVWTPCVGLIMASVISLALTGAVTTETWLITLVYAIGTAVPMMAIMVAGPAALRRIPGLVENAGEIQKGFGMLMILTAVAIFFNIDRRFQTFVLEKFPNYGVGLTKFEDNRAIKSELQKVNLGLANENIVGRPASEVVGPKGPKAPELILGGQWFNSEPLRLADLRGKVVLIDFWTYSCINCQRTLPYLRDWWNKYKDKGLIIIGVHSPEFEFEKKAGNVEQALSEFGLTYPVMQDNNFGTWRAYGNQYWPAKYLIDKDGVVRYTHFGEGEYDTVERNIQGLLQEVGAEVAADQILNVDYNIDAQTPELYLGYARIERLVSPEKIKPGEEMLFTVPNKLGANSFAYGGRWTLMPEYASPRKGSVIELDFDAKEVFLVARSRVSGGTVRVYIDGEMKNFGEDNIDGLVKIDEAKLYKLIKLSGAEIHRLRIEFLDDGVEVYAFTFG